MTQASPTVINDITDLYRILDEQPQWKEALRNQILVAELLAVPQRLAQLTEQIHELREFMGQLAQTAAEHSGQLTELTAQLKELRAITEEHTRQLAELTTQVKELRETVAKLAEAAAEQGRELTNLRHMAENHVVRMDRMESDFGEIKGLIAESSPDRTIQVIATILDLFRPTLVARSELAELSRQLNIERSTRISFVNADLVFTAEDRDTPVYCAVEISWTIAQRDIDRAHRNANLLQHATRIPARAVAVGHRYEDNLNWTGVHWVSLTDP